MVRDDRVEADIVFMQSEYTFYAYNPYGWFRYVRIHRVLVKDVTLDRLQIVEVNGWIHERVSLPIPRYCVCSTFEDGVLLTLGLFSI